VVTKEVAISMMEKKAVQAAVVLITVMEGPPNTGMARKR
jgi:hypothetical protein